MIRALLVVALMLPLPLLAQEAANHDHNDSHEDEHVTEARGIRAVHAWTNATEGQEAYVFVDLENTTDEPVTLLGGSTGIAQAVTLVGFANNGGELSYAPIPQMPIAGQSEIVLSPNGLAMQLTGLSQPLVQGGTFEMEFLLDKMHLDVVVEIESATATQHSHAGHQH